MLPLLPTKMRSHLQINFQTFYSMWIYQEISCKVITPTIIRKNLEFTILQLIHSNENSPTISTQYPHEYRWHSIIVPSPHYTIEKRIRISLAIHHQVYPCDIILIIQQLWTSTACRCHDANHMQMLRHIRPQKPNQRPPFPIRCHINNDTPAQTTLDIPSIILVAKASKSSSDFFVWSFNDISFTCRSWRRSIGLVSDDDNSSQYKNITSCLLFQTLNGLNKGFLFL